MAGSGPVWGAGLADWFRFAPALFRKPREQEEVVRELVSLMPTDGAITVRNAAKVFIVWWELCLMAGLTWWAVYNELQELSTTRKRR